MTRNGAKFEKKRKKYNIITFSLLAFFFLFVFLSKHLKEPVKPAAKTHHISHTLSSKSSSSHKKEKTKSSTTTSKEDEKKMLKTKIKIKHLLLFRHQIKNKTTKHPTKMEIKKSPSLLKVDEVGADQKMAPMPQTEEAVVVTMLPSPQVLVEEAITQAQPIRAMIGLTTLITILTSTHKLHQVQIQLPIPINELTEYLSSPVFYFQP